MATMSNERELRYANLDPGSGARSRNHPVGRTSARADASDDTLRYYSKRADLILDVTISKLGGALFGELGVANYLPTFKVNAVAKGELPEGDEPVSVRIVRFELSDEDRLPYLEDGARVVLFLKAQATGTKPTYQTTDFWFGVQPHSPWLVRRLTQLNQQQTRSRVTWVNVASSSSAQPEALDTVHAVLDKHDIDAVGVSNAGGETVCVAPQNVKRARKLLRKALESPAAARARKDAERLGQEPPAEWAFTVMDTK